MEDFDDHFHDECGVFAVYGAPEANKLTYLGLHALQHRGQESAGIVTSNGKQLFAQRRLGRVQECFSEETMQKLPGNCAIGHVRYSTAGGTHIKNAQPFAVDYAHGSLAIAHNGNLTNGVALRKELEGLGSIFASTSDTEVIVHLIARAQGRTLYDRVVEALRRVEGAYSLVILSESSLVVARDPYGFRPLCLGILQDAPLFASEPPSFELLGGEFIRDVEPGEVIVVDEGGMRSTYPFKSKPRKMCVFEYVYFARPDAVLEGVSVYESRKRMGAALARQSPVDVDLVVPVPDSGVPAAMGYAREAGLPFEFGLIRSHYIGRTFIEPSQSIRHFGVKLKLQPQRQLLAGKRVAVIDDSIVRGTTSRKLVRMLRDAGAKEVHLRISSPPTRWPCFYGIDTPRRSELIAASYSPEEIARYVTADSLAYLEPEGLHASVGDGGFCDACFTGNYPIAPGDPEESPQRRLPLVAE